MNRRSLPTLLVTIACLTTALLPARAQDDQVRESRGTVANLPPEVRGSIVNQLAKLTSSNGMPGDYFGFSAAMSGNTVVVGAPFAKVGNNGYEGSAYVFVKPATGWANMTETAILTASDGTTNGDFGLAVAISGNLVVVEASYGGAIPATAYVYLKPATGWANMTQTAKLSTPVNDLGGGYPPSISTDGNTIVVGVPWGSLRGQFTGAVYIFSKPATGWVNMSSPTAELTTLQASGYFGTSVAVNGNVIAATRAGISPVYLFVKPKKGWSGIKTETAQLSASNGDGLSSVALNGNTIAAGSGSSNSAQGAVYVFLEPASGWANMTETAKLTASDGAVNDALGTSVAINGGGSEITTSAPGRSSKTGGVYAFVKPASGWVNATENTEFAASDAVAGYYLGHSIGMYGSRTVAGAPEDLLSSAGAAYVF